MSNLFDIGPSVDEITRISQDFEMPTLLRPAPRSPTSQRVMPSSDFGDSTEFQRSAPPPTSTLNPNSKAVMSALRTLQDKIKKVEDEKNLLNRQCRQLEDQLRQVLS